MMDEGVWKCEKKVCSYSGNADEVDDHLTLMNADVVRNGYRDLDKIHAWGRVRIDSEWEGKK